VLFHPILSQLLALEEPRENCAAWIATLPNDAVPSALAGCSLMLYGTSRKAAEDAVNFLASAMAPTSKVTPASTAQWRDAPRDQQPARPVCEGVQYVLS
jgi:hypothetical protein